MNNDNCTSDVTPNRERLTKSVTGWIERTDDDEFEDGSQLLVAVPVVNRHIESGWHYEYSVITVTCDEYYFDVTCEGEAWGWCMTDVDYYIRLT